jgi:hypothetical protein
MLVSGTGVPRIEIFDRSDSRSSTANGRLIVGKEINLSIFFPASEVDVGVYVIRVGLWKDGQIIVIMEKGIGRRAWSR